MPVSDATIAFPIDRPHLEEYIVQRIKTVLPNVQGIYLFGSRATGHFRPDSDYDVAVLCDLPIKNEESFFRLQIELAALTESGVNIVDIRSLPIVIQFEVLRGRRRLFCADRDFRIIFEANILSKYQRFEEVERQPVIKAFLNRRLAHVSK
jgi:predicted nucleotidyltransferase